jgi:hypothetical protein
MCATASQLVATSRRLGGVCSHAVSHDQVRAYIKGRGDAHEIVIAFSTGQQGNDLEYNP